MGQRGGVIAFHSNGFVGIARTTAARPGRACAAPANLATGANATPVRECEDYFSACGTSPDFLSIAS